MLDPMQLIGSNQTHHEICLIDSSPSFSFLFFFNLTNDQPDFFELKHRSILADLRGREGERASMRRECENITRPIIIRSSLSKIVPKKLRMPSWNSILTSSEVD